MGPHVRATDPGLTQLIATAAARSSTLAALLARLDDSDVIVYVGHAVLDSRLRARLRFAGTSGGWRYLRVEIDCRQNLSEQVAFLGHELQHAAEIAGATATVDNGALQRLYREIGFALDRVQWEWLLSGMHRHRVVNARANY